MDAMQTRGTVQKSSKWHGNFLRANSHRHTHTHTHTHTQTHMQKQPGSFRACKHQLSAQLHCSLRHQSQGASSPHCLVVEICLQLPNFKRTLYHDHYECIHLVLEITHTRKSLSWSKTPHSSASPSCCSEGESSPQVESRPNHRCPPLGSQPCSQRFSQHLRLPALHGQCPGNSCHCAACALQELRKFCKWLVGLISGQTWHNISYLQSAFLSWQKAGHVKRILHGWITDRKEKSTCLTK